MEVQINRGRILARRILNSIVGFGILLIVLLTPSIRGYLNITRWALGSILTAVIFIGFCVYDWLYCKTLKYEVKGGQLISSYQIITKRKDIARLQVVNNILIHQGLIDKLFDLFTVEVSYGFSQYGHKFYFYGLSEQEANRVADSIKSKGRLIQVN